MSAPAEAAFSHPVRVYWEDTDAGGVVFYANYLKYFERARTEWLRERGVGQQRLSQESGGLFVVSEVRVRFVQPARLDDLLSVTVTVKEPRAASMILHQAAWRADLLLAEGDIRIGYVDAATLKPLRIPDAVLTCIA